MKKVLQSIVTLLFFAVLFALVVGLEAGNQTALTGRPAIIDGDSLEIGSERLRLWGIDAPELRQTCKRDGQSWPCGRESRTALRKLTGGRVVSCVTNGIDKYGRWLVECEVEGRSINQAMVERGWAIAYGGFETTEDRARRKQVGLWSGEFEPPSDWREAQRGDLAGSNVQFLRVGWMRVRRLAKSVFGL